jgi:FMN-dependent NADH-azoreductase
MTTTVLHIDASARFADSVSRVASAARVAELGADTVIRRDLAKGLPYLDEVFTTATFTPPENRTDAQNEALAISDTLVAELQAADTIVIGAAMYNFSIPAVLKAWIDQIARAGVTFAYTETGPKGLLEGKKSHHHHRLWRDAAGLGLRFRLGLPAFCAWFRGYHRCHNSGQRRHHNRCQGGLNA